MSRRVITDLNMNCSVTGDSFTSFQIHEFVNHVVTKIETGERQPVHSHQVISVPKLLVDFHFQITGIVNVEREHFIPLIMKIGLACLFLISCALENDKQLQTCTQPFTLHDSNVQSVHFGTNNTDMREVTGKLTVMCYCRQQQTKSNTYGKRVCDTLGLTHPRFWYHQLP